MLDQFDNLYEKECCKVYLKRQDRLILVMWHGNFELIGDLRGILIRICEHVESCVHSFTIDGLLVDVTNLDGNYGNPANWMTSRIGQRLISAGIACCSFVVPENHLQSYSSTVFETLSNQMRIGYFTNQIEAHEWLAAL